MLLDQVEKELKVEAARHGDYWISLPSTIYVAKRHPVYVKEREW